jgi:hypothetical protein
LIPDPGQYVLAYEPKDKGDALAHPLFPGDLLSKREAIRRGEFQTAMPVPPNWHPGTLLNLRGPMGNGFQLPASINRLALVVQDRTASCLLPLISPVLQAGGDVAFFSSGPLAWLPSSVEIHPLEALPESLNWMDFLVVALRWQSLPTLRETVGLRTNQYLGIDSQALILTPMPCGGLADCGVCAVPAHRDYKLVCRDGPVFDLDELAW